MDDEGEYEEKLEKKIRVRLRRVLQRFSVENRNDSFRFDSFICGIFGFHRKFETCVPALKNEKMSNRTHAPCAMCYAPVLSIGQAGRPRARS